MSGITALPMSQEKIAKGDVVCLKSGGHDMTAARDPDEDGDVLCKWFVIVVFLMASFDILGLSQVNIFLRSVVAYLPSVIVAALVLIGLMLLDLPWVRRLERWLLARPTVLTPINRLRKRFGKPPFHHGDGAAA